MRVRNRATFLQSRRLLPHPSQQYFHYSLVRKRHLCEVTRVQAATPLILICFPASAFPLPTTRRCLMSLLRRTCTGRHWLSPRSPPYPCKSLAPGLTFCPPGPALRQTLKPHRLRQGRVMKGTCGHAQRRNTAQSCGGTKDKVSANLGLFHSSLNRR